MKICVTSISSLGFNTREYEAIEQINQYRLSGDGRRQVVHKVSMLNPVSLLKLERVPVSASVWHLPEDTDRAKSRLIAFCRERVRQAKATAVAMNTMVEKSSKTLDELASK